MIVPFKRIVIFGLLFLLSNSFTLAQEKNCTLKQLQEVTSFIFDAKHELVYFNNIDLEMFTTYLLKGGYQNNCYKLYNEGNFKLTLRSDKILAVKKDILYGEWERELKASDMEIVIQGAAFLELSSDMKNQIMLLDATRFSLFAAAELVERCPVCIEILRNQFLRYGSEMAVAATHSFTSEAIIETVIKFIGGASSNSMSLVLKDNEMQNIIMRAVNKATPNQLRQAGMYNVPVISGIAIFGFELWKWYHTGQTVDRTVANVVSMGVGVAGAHFGCYFGSIVGTTMGNPLVGCVLGSFLGNYLSTAAAKKVLFWILSIPAEEAVEKAYKFLEVAPTASNNDVKAAYRKLALQYHPDKGGSDEDFTKLITYYQLIQASRADVPHVKRRKPHDDCNYLDIFNRIDAGYPGITKSSCLQKPNTCYDSSHSEVPNCYISKKHIRTQIHQLLDHLKIVIRWDSDCIFYKLKDEQGLHLCQIVIPMLKAQINGGIDACEDALTTEKVNVDCANLEDIIKKIDLAYPILQRSIRNSPLITGHREL